MAGNRDHALSCLSRVSDDSDAPLALLLAEAQVHALLDIADAIREGHARPEEPRADIARDFHTEAIEGVAGAVADVGITLEAIRNEVADLRCTVAKLGGR